MAAKSSTCISFVIPAYNEQENLALTIKAITQGAMSVPYEIIVVDNGSMDDTVALAGSLGVKVLSKPAGTIASVRNFGVKHSKGNILIFLDADVSLTEQWFKSIDEVIDLLQVEPLLVTGSHCAAPSDGNWIERYWFDNYAHEQECTNLGTGHMIMTRELFELTNGFDETLYTGEDYSFCMSAIGKGGRILNKTELYVIHRSYPKNFIEYIRREAWHGIGDVKPVKKILQSKVAMASLVFIGLHLAALFVLLLPVLHDGFVVLPVSGLIVLIVLSSYMKFKHCSLKIILMNSVIYYLYFLGRSISLLALLGINIKK